MRIQGRLLFSQDDVTCSPVDPALSGYTDTLSFGDPALDFRLRLFGARISQAGPAAFVALVLPEGMVLCDRPPAEEGQDADALPFDGIPETELHVFEIAPDGLPARLAVERIVLDEMISFARHHGLCPLEVVIPTFEGAHCIILPVHGANPAGTGETAPASPAVQPDQRREMIRRRPQDVEAESPPASGPTAGRAGAPVGSTPILAEAPVPDADRPQPAPPPPMASAAIPTAAAPARLPAPAADPAAPSLSPSRTHPALHAPVAAPALPASGGPRKGPARLGRALGHAARPVLSPLARLDWDRLARPAPLAAASILAVVGLAGAFVADRFATPGPEIRAAAPLIAPPPLVADPARPSPPAEAAPAGATDRHAALPEPAPEAPAPRPDPQPVALAVRSAPADPVVLPDIELTTTVSPAPAPSYGVPPASVMPLAVGGETAARVQPGLSLPVVTPVPAPGSQPAAAPLPDVAIALPTEILGTPETPSGDDAGPTVWSDIGPDATPPALPEPSARDEVHAAVAAQPHLGGPPSPRAPDGIRPPEPVRTADLPVSAEPLDPAPRARVAPPVEPTEPPAALAALPVAPRALSPERAPRPPVRPAALSRPPEPAAPTPPGSVARTAVVPVPVARPQQLLAPIATEVEPTPIPSIEVVPPGGASGLRVLAIVGADTQRQALVQTGQNQTTVLSTGTNLGSWWVVEVRRDGVVMANGDRQRFLPFGS